MTAATWTPAEGARIRAAAPHGHAMAQALLAERTAMEAAKANRMARIAEAKAEARARWRAAVRARRASGQRPA